jgi:glycosyltransferase involved in cell wall biosynthesis
VKATVVALHNNGYRSKLPVVIMPIRRSLFRQSTVVTALSRGHGRYIERKYGVPGSKVWIVPNGVDLSRFDDHAAGGPSVSFADRGKKKVVAIIAFLRPEKAYDVFLQMASSILRQRKDVEFWIVGDGPERGAIEKRIGEMGIGGAVRLLGYRQDIPSVLRACDIVTVTSDAEDVPIVILEAMAAGRPVAATDVGFIREIVSNGQTGFIVPPRDPERLAETVSYLLSREDFMAKMGSAGRKKVEKWLSIRNTFGGPRDAFSQPCRLTSGIHRLFFLSSYYRLPGSPPFRRSEEVSTPG